MKNVNIIFNSLLLLVCVAFALILTTVMWDVWALPVRAENTVQGGDLSKGMRDYTDNGYGFKIQFPESIKQDVHISKKSLNSSLGLPSDTPLWKFSLDNDLHSKTNLVDASLLIHVMKSKKAVKNCSAFEDGSIYKTRKSHLSAPPTVDINGVTFYKDIVEEKGMGEEYSRTIFKTVRHRACYSMTLLVHSKHIGGYADAEIKEFPESQVRDTLRSMANTFTFLDISPTFPKQSYSEDETGSFSKSLSESGSEYADGIDVSHWQEEIDWVEVANAGYSFAFAKATEGVGWKDWSFVTNIEEGTEAGVIMSPYHYARPDLDNTGQEEAEYFLSEVGDYIQSGYIRPVLDLEESGGLGREALSNWVVEWMETVKSRTGVEPIIYTNYYYIQEKLNQSVMDYSLWIAYWTCDPTPSFDIPPTGGFGDWDFWQYQAPAACGDYSIPGISGGVDLNIFNGGESQLTIFEAESPLWVTLMGDATSAPIPYFADLVVDVNGDATGPIDYYMWWNCPAWGTGLSELEEECGDLPVPGIGSCQSNLSGLRCNKVEDENLLVEHTFDEINDYTVKSVVDRSEAPRAEDRYKISTYNPITSISPDPPQPVNAVVGTTFQLDVGVRMDTSLPGAVQVEVLDAEQDVLIDQDCQAIEGNVRKTMSFDFSLTETETVLKEYLIWVRYHRDGTCPVQVRDYYDRSLTYAIQWGYPEITMSGNGTSIPDGQSTSSLDDGTNFGNVPITHAPVTHLFTIGNTGKADLALMGTPKVEISGPDADAFYVVTQPPESVPSDGGQVVFEVAFAPGSTGVKTGIIRIENNDNDENPYDFVIQGTGTTLEKEVADFDGDGNTDVSVYRPSNGYWYVQGQSPTWWGLSGDLPVPGDYDGDGVMDIAVYRPQNGKWYIHDGDLGEWWGTVGDIPVQGDYDGDGVTDMAVYRPSTGEWLVKGRTPVWWGIPEDIPSPGDYDGDGITDIAVYRPSNGKWFLYDEENGESLQPEGIPVPGDYDGDGVDEFAVYQPDEGLWYISGRDPVWWGIAGDVPVPGDYDGDGMTDIAVLRPSNGTWYVKDQISTWFYIEGDYPLPVRDTNADGDPHQ